jgi:hypothetical protein
MRYGFGTADVVVRVADAGDSGAIASLRSLWSAGTTAAHPAALPPARLDDQD